MYAGGTFTVAATTIPKPCGRELRNEVAVGCRRAYSGCHALKSSGPIVADDNDTATRLDRLLVVHQVQELLAGLWVVPEHTQHRRGHCLAVDLLHASHHHAHMPATYAKEFFSLFLRHWVRIAYN